MKSKTVKIAGKDIGLCYCYATEIGYKMLSDEDVHTFMAEARSRFSEEKMPDIRKTIFMIIASANAYSEWKGDPAGITDRELMYETAPSDIAAALGAIISLFSEFYYIPESEPEDGNEGADTKNA